MSKTNFYSRLSELMPTNPEGRYFAAIFAKLLRHNKNIIKKLFPSITSTSDLIVTVEYPIEGDERGFYDICILRGTEVIAVIEIKAEDIHLKSNDTQLKKYRNSLGKKGKIIVISKYTPSVELQGTLSKLNIPYLTYRSLLKILESSSRSDIEVEFYQYVNSLVPKVNISISMQDAFLLSHRLVGGPWKTGFQAKGLGRPSRDALFKIPRVLNSLMEVVEAAANDFHDIWGVKIFERSPSLDVRSGTIYESDEAAKFFSKNAEEEHYTQTPSFKKSLEKTCFLSVSSRYVLKKAPRGKKRGATETGAFWFCLWVEVDFESKKVSLNTEAGFWSKDGKEKFNLDSDKRKYFKDKDTILKIDSEKLLQQCAKSFLEEYEKNHIDSVIPNHGEEFGSILEALRDLS